MADGLDHADFDGAGGLVGLAQHRSLGGVPHRPEANSLVRRLLHGGSLPFPIQAQQVLQLAQRGSGRPDLAVLQPRAATFCSGLLGGFALCGLGLWPEPSRMA